MQSNDFKIYYITVFSIRCYILESNHLALRGGNFYSKLCSQILHTDEIKKEDAQINNLTL
jgi:hypothetical protein